MKPHPCLLVTFVGIFACSTRPGASPEEPGVDAGESTHNGTDSGGDPVAASTTGAGGADTQGSTTAAPQDASSAGEPGTDDTADDTTDGATAQCAPPGPSLCDNPAAVIGGLVHLPPGTPDQSGDLVVALLHRRYGSPDVGGHPHMVRRYPDVTVRSDTPYAFTLDMCDANASMWSEENCEYNLVVILDGNGNNGLSPANLAVPDPGEPAVLAVLDVSCHAQGPHCLELELSCLDGQACVQYPAPPKCECAENSCGSQASICGL